MKIPKIQTVCGFGCGSSLMLKMNVEAIARKNDVKIDIFCSDVGTCTSNQCDVIFISKELAERITDRVKVPVVIINNFMDKKEVEEKCLDYFKTLEE